MMIENISMDNGNGTFSSVSTKRGVVVGWSKTPSINSTVYHVLVVPNIYSNQARYQNPIISTLWEGKDGMLKLFFTFG